MKRFKRFMMTALSIATGLYAASASVETFIVKDGKPGAEIIIADKPARMSKLAASELQTYIEKISGAKLAITNDPDKKIPVKIYVGKSKYTDDLKLSTEGLAHGAFRMVSGDNWLALFGPDKDFEPLEPWVHERKDRERVLREWDAISGNTFATPYSQIYRWRIADPDVWMYDDAGTLNAVYEFLRSLGVRWYFPGEIGEIVPKKETVVLPVLDKTVKPDFPLRNVMWWGIQEMNPDEILWALRMGINYGPELIGLTQSCHGMKFATTRDEIKKAHPEYYALWNGRRATDHRECGAPCLSSEGLFKLHMQYARAVLDHYKEPLISLDTCDGYGQLCQCELCKGKDTPARGWTGSMSDYVWGYIDRAAREIYKTHPDRKVSGLSYSAYKLPPEKIKELSPNISLLMCQTRSTFHDPELRDQARTLRKEWLKILPSKEMFVFEYYLQNRPDCPTAGVPVYFPRLIAEDLRSLKGISRGETVDSYFNFDPKKSSAHAQAVMHLNWYVTARLWWDANQDLDAMLDEYFNLFYGPANREMKAFVEYSEKNWPSMTTKVETIDKALELLAAARKAAGDSVYGKRVDLIVAYVEPLKKLREKLAAGRANAPRFTITERDPAGLVVDGKLDEAFWKDVQVYEFKDIVTGQVPTNAATARFAWADRALVVGVRCEDADMAHVTAYTLRNDDPNLWNEDNIELLLETPVHSYYQIAVNSAGYVMDMDREKRNILWNSEAEVAAAKDEKGWTIEMKIPSVDLIEGGMDKSRRVAGTKPTAKAPWYFNLYRHRARGKAVEGSALAPTGGKLHDPLKFGELIVK
jgi:hypothetical protein